MLYFDPGLYCQLRFFFIQNAVCQTVATFSISAGFKTKNVAKLEIDYTEGTIFCSKISTDTEHGTESESLRGF